MIKILIHSFIADFLPESVLEVEVGELPETGDVINLSAADFPPGRYELTADGTKEIGDVVYQYYKYAQVGEIDLRVEPCPLKHISIE